MTSEEREALAHKIYSTIPEEFHIGDMSIVMGLVLGSLLCGIQPNFRGGFIGIVIDMAYDVVKKHLVSKLLSTEGFTKQ
jgi:hypothetical protein